MIISEHFFLILLNFTFISFLQESALSHRDAASSTNLSNLSLTAGIEGTTLPLVQSDLQEFLAAESPVQMNTRTWQPFSWGSGTLLSLALPVADQFTTKTLQLRLPTAFRKRMVRRLQQRTLGWLLEKARWGYSFEKAPRNCCQYSIPSSIMDSIQVDSILQLMILPCSNLPVHWIIQAPCGSFEWRPQMKIRLMVYAHYFWKYLNVNWIS